MDELESRLADGLSRHASDLPLYEGDLRKVTRRGRNRRWAARGAGAVGALALLGGGVAVYGSINDRGQQVATDEPTALVLPAATPTPTPEPTPLPTPEPTPDADAEPGATPAPEQIRDVFAVSAAGWGVGLVGAGGDYFTTLACCEEDDWAAQPAGVPALGAVRVRDDLAGGIVASTANTLWWQPAASLAAGDPIALDTLLADTPDTDVRVDLWDVQLLDDRLRILYSTAAIDAEGGLARLLVAEIADDTPAPPTVLAEKAWKAGDGKGYVWAGAGWVASGGHMELRSAVDLGCEWVVYTDTDPAFETRFAAPDATDGCPQDSIGGAAVNAEGQLVVIERFLANAPLTAQLAVYDRVGNELWRTDLPETAEGQPRWTELDVVDSAVLVSRATADLAADEVLRIDIGADGPVRTLPFTGNPAFARSNIATADLTLVAPGDPRWFGPLDALAAEPTPLPDDGQEPAPTPAATPVASPSTTPEPVPDPTPTDPAADLPADVRTPTGRDGEPLASGRVEGDDGCLLDGLLCLGMSLEDAEAAIATAPQPVAVWLSSTGDAVGSVLVLPSDGPAGPFLGTDGDLRVADVLRRLGAPAEIRFESGPDPDGVEIRTFWLIYETDAGVIGYGVTTSDPEDTLLVDPGEDRVPEEFDSLLITSYQAAAAS